MPVTIIENIPIIFPFEPYDIQKKYMGKVIECLQNGKHGMLESPTGTGKTLSLLCSSLAWLTTKMDEINKANKESREPKDEENSLLDDINLVGTSGKETKKPQPLQIIYSSRTHSQLTQAISELRRTHYAYVNSAVIGSRHQLCIDPFISQETSSGVQISKCHAAKKKKSCLYHNNVESTKDNPVFHEEVLDIEDLVRIGQKLSTCPYYMTKELKTRADIVFMPYNYLLDNCVRKKLDIKLENCVVILDEGHNVEKLCEDSASFELCWSDINTCVEELTEIIDAVPRIGKQVGQLPPFCTGDLKHLREVMFTLQTSIDKIYLRKSDKSAKYGGRFIFDLLDNAQINHQNFHFLNTLMSSIIDWINSNEIVSLKYTGSGLDRLQNFLQIVFYNDGCSIEEHKKKVSESYKVYVALENQTRNKPDSRFVKDDKPVKLDAKVVNFWCFNPAFGMRSLLNEGVRSVIITSGTLSPLEPLICELGIPIDVTLESGHVASKDQLYVGVLQSGPDKYTLNSSFKTRSDPAYMQSLGRTIQNVARLIPHGLLVFFPSYAVMDKCIDEWISNGLWDAINKTKELCVEPRNKRDLKEVMNRYYSKNSEPGSKGACFLAVCRGKVSEGLDFIDHNGRGVIITGLPYPPLLDPRVVMKREYLTEYGKKVSGEQWYQLEATRAVNQAIGRVMRHKNDYGVILFCDTRFSTPDIRKNLSSWLRNQVKIHGTFSQLPRSLVLFFQNAKETLPQPVIKPLIAECSDDDHDDDHDSLTTSSSKSEYMASRYTGRFAQRYEQNYLRSKFAWLNKRRGARGRPKRYRNETITSTSVDTSLIENMPTQPGTNHSISSPEESLTKALNVPTFSAGSLSSGDSFGSVPTGVVAASCSENCGLSNSSALTTRALPNSSPYSGNISGGRACGNVPVQSVAPMVVNRYANVKTYGNRRAKRPIGSLNSSVRTVNVPTQAFSSAVVPATGNAEVYYVYLQDQNVNHLAAGSTILVDGIEQKQLSVALPQQTDSTTAEGLQYFLVNQNVNEAPAILVNDQYVLLDQNVQYVIAESDPQVYSEDIQIDD